MYVRSITKGDAISHQFEDIGIIYDMPMRVGEHLCAVGKAEPATREEYLAQCERYTKANQAAADADGEPEQKTDSPKSKAKAETR